MNAKTLGWIYIAIGLPGFIAFFIWGNPQYAFWFSNHAFMIMGIALLLNSRFWIMAELCLGLIPEIVWNVDFLARLFTGDYVWGFTSYMFTETGFAWSHLYSLQHVLLVPAGLFALFVMKGSTDKAYLGSFLHGGIMWGCSFLFSSEYNVNCVWSSCTGLSLPYYRIAWPLLMMVSIMVTYAMLKFVLRKLDLEK